MTDARRVDRSVGTEKRYETLLRYKRCWHRHIKNRHGIDAGLGRQNKWQKGEWERESVVGIIDRAEQVKCMPRKWYEDETGTANTWTCQVSCGKGQVTISIINYDSKFGPSYMKNEKWTVFVLRVWTNVLNWSICALYVRHTQADLSPCLAAAEPDDGVLLCSLSCCRWCHTLYSRQHNNTPYTPTNMNWMNHISIHTENFMAENRNSNTITLLRLLFGVAVTAVAALIGYDSIIVGDSSSLLRPLSCLCSLQQVAKMEEKREEEEK